MQAIANEPSPGPRSWIRWATFVFGAWVLTLTLLGLEALLSLTTGWPSSGDAATVALIVAPIVNIFAATITMGVVVHLSGRRQWLVGLLLVIAADYLPGLLVSMGSALLSRP